MELLRIAVESRHLPRVEWGYDPAAPAEPVSPEAPWFLRWLRPRIKVTGLVNVERAPWGEPGPSTWPLILLLPGGLVVVLVLLWMRLRRRRRAG